MFKLMTTKELKAYIEGCNSAKEYDQYFEDACAEYNFRTK